MSYKTDLQGNNTDLQSILDMILALGLVDAPKLIPVTITGTGNSAYCYATINGTTYTEATSGIEVKAGDTITFYVHGSATASKYVKINDVYVVTKDDGAVEGTYDWIVPDGITDITIQLYYYDSGRVKTSNINVATV